MVDRGLPYAQALLSLAENDQQIDAFAAQFDKVRSVFKENPELKAWLNHPGIPSADKEKLLLEIFEGAPAVFLDFLKIVCRHGMSGQLISIADDYGKLTDELRNIENVRVTSAVPLDEEQKARLKAVLEKKFGKTVRLFTDVDPALIAGMKIESEQTLTDASYSGRLENMKEQLRRS